MAEENSNKFEAGSLEITPTWAVALVCSIFVLASFALERAIHYTGRWLRRRNEKSLYQALDKIREELMLLGFISLLLTVFQPVIAGICLPYGYIDHMLPCKANTAQIKEESQGETTHNNSTSHSRRFLQEHLRRVLAEEGGRSKCFGKRKLPFISNEGLHQLHIFIFVLAVVHVVYSCLTMLLGRYKVHAWHTWEKEARAQTEPGHTAAKKRGILARQTTFLRKHANPMWISSDFMSWIVCFLRQFGRSVSRTEYQTLRTGFIRNHDLAASFDFHRYVLRALEDDFRKVVGISGYLWVFVVLFLLINVNGWHTYFWIAFLPLALLLIIGAKLEHVITSLGVEIVEEQKSQTAPVAVNLRDELFWFNKPKLILYLLHFVLFQNAFELAFFIWIWATYGFDSCFMDNLGFVITRLVIGVVVQVLCSYSTLPLYALVTQMGKHFKFGEEIQSAILGLHAKAKKKSVHNGGSSQGQKGTSSKPGVDLRSAVAAARMKKSSGQDASPTDGEDSAGRNDRDREVEMEHIPYERSQRQDS